MVPANVSMVGAGVMVAQVSTPMGMGTALTRESGGNVTRPVSSTVPARRTAQVARRLRQERFIRLRQRLTVRPGMAMTGVGGGVGCGIR